MTQQEAEKLIRLGQLDIFNKAIDILLGHKADKSDVEDNEKVTAAALNDLKQTIEDNELVTAAALNDLNKAIEDNEKVTAAALNDLNERVSAGGGSGTHANCVTSSTSGLKIEVVQSMPASPDTNTVYIVTE